MTFCYVALGLFLGEVCLLVLMHPASGNPLRITPTHFLFVGGIVWGGIGFWIGWSEGSKRYLPNETKRAR
jgi:hypothetical protein